GVTARLPVQAVAVVGGRDWDLAHRGRSTRARLQALRRRGPETGDEDGAGTVCPAPSARPRRPGRDAAEDRHAAPVPGRAWRPHRDREVAVAQVDARTTGRRTG